MTSPTPMKVEQIKPCPFCGGEAELTGHKAPEFWVMCPAIGCKASTEAFGSKDKAIAAWNRRASTPVARSAAASLLRWLEQASPHNSDSDFNQGVARGFEIIKAQLENGHIPEQEFDTIPSREPGEDDERICRLRREVRRLREEAALDDRAASNTKNEDARGTFIAIAAAKRERADDIEALLAALSEQPRPVDDVEMRETLKFYRDSWEATAVCMIPSRELLEDEGCRARSALGHKDRGGE